MALSRSQQMERIRGRDTGPEVILRKALWALGLRYRLQARTPVGRPDIVFPRQRVAVFVDGCFWHGCPQHYVRPRSREAFWSAKLTENVARDRSQTMALEELGWTVLRVWEHSVHAELETILERVDDALNGIRERLFDDWRVVRVEELEGDAWRERRHLERLRESSRTEVTEGRRITAKWKRP